MIQSTQNTSHKAREINLCATHLVYYNGLTGLSKCPSNLTRLDLFMLDLVFLHSIKFQFISTTFTVVGML